MGLKTCGAMPFVVAHIWGMGFRVLYAEYLGNWSAVELATRQKRKKRHRRAQDVNKYSYVTI